MNMACIDLYVDIDWAGLFFVNLTQGKIIQEQGTSIEKMLP